MIIRTFIRSNNKIRVAQVRCISETGEQVGVVATSEALKMALAKGLDLVEVAPNASPPVCRIMDFGKYRYEETRKDKQARKHQSTATLKEIKFHINVEDHDYMTKLNHMRQFISKGHRVKVSLLFRGRENEHRDLGYAVFERIVKDTTDVAVCESSPKLFGRNLVMLLRPDTSGKT